MRLLPHEHGEGQLALPAPVQLEILGAPDGGVAVGVALDQVQHRCAAEKPAAGVDALAGHDHAVADPLHLGKQLRVHALRGPVHHCLLPVEQAARRQQRRAHAQAGDLAAARWWRASHSISARLFSTTSDTEPSRGGAMQMSTAPASSSTASAWTVMRPSSSRTSRVTASVRTLNPGGRPCAARYSLATGSPAGGLQGSDVRARGQQESDIFHGGIVLFSGGARRPLRAARYPAHPFYPAKNTPEACRNPPARLSQSPIGSARGSR